MKVSLTGGEVNAWLSAQGQLNLLELTTPAGGVDSVCGCRRAAQRHAWRCDNGGGRSGAECVRFRAGSGADISAWWHNRGSNCGARFHCRGHGQFVGDSGAGFGSNIGAWRGVWRCDRGIRRQRDGQRHVRAGVDCLRCRTLPSTWPAVSAEDPPGYAAGSRAGAQTQSTSTSRDSTRHRRRIPRYHRENEPSTTTATLNATAQLSPSGGDMGRILILRSSISRCFSCTSSQRGRL